jgi:hypothetical protein
VAVGSVPSKAWSSWVWRPRSRPNRLVISGIWSPGSLPEWHEDTIGS